MTWCNPAFCIQQLRVPHAFLRTGKVQPGDSALSSHNEIEVKPQEKTATPTRAVADDN